MSGSGGVNVRGAGRRGAEHSPPDEERHTLRTFYETSNAYRRMLDAPPSMTAAQRTSYLNGYVDYVAAASSPGQRVLDLGCGTGRTSTLLHQRGRMTCGLDWSYGLVRIGAREAGYGGPSYLVGDVEQLPFADGTFDVVASQDLLEHTLDPARVLGEMARVLAPGGTIVVKCPNLLSPLRPLWYLANLLLRRRPTPVWAETPWQALRSIAYNTVLTTMKVLTGRPGFIRRQPTLGVETVHEDADATQLMSAVDLRRWLSHHGFSVEARRPLSNDNRSQAMVRRLLPDLASPVALVARRRSPS